MHSLCNWLEQISDDVQLSFHSVLARDKHHAGEVAFIFFDPCIVQINFRVPLSPTQAKLGPVK